MILRTSPAPWNSVHRPIEYVYDHEQLDLLAVANASGKLRLLVDGTFTHTLSTGDKIAIEGVGGEPVASAYNTIHTVAGVSGSFITTGTNYAGAVFSVDVIVKFIRLPEIKLYSGYLSGEEYPGDLPITHVATFTPQNSPDNNSRFDVSEYLRSIFRISPPAEGIDFNMFNRFRLRFDNVYKESYMVLNASIKTGELNAKYVNTNSPLNSKLPPIVFGCGKTIVSYLTGNVVTNTLAETQTSVNGRYNNDFSNDFNHE